MTSLPPEDPRPSDPASGPTPPPAPIAPGRTPVPVPPGDDGEGIQVRPLAFAILACAVAVVLALALAPDDPAFWEQELVRPTPFVPDVVILLFELLRMAGLALFAVLLYRAQVHLEDPVRKGVLGVLLGIMAAQATWNPLMAAMGSLQAGAVAAGILAAVMVGLVVFLYPRDRASAWVLLPYALLNLHDLWWAWELARLNPT
jgi:tryptophan-rich sensory protein